MTLSIVCPNCGATLSTADWEQYEGVLDLGDYRRISLVCLNCHNEYILQVVLSQVIRLS
jgi:hypothetical protein